MNKKSVALSILSSLLLGLSTQVSAALILEQYASGASTPTVIGGNSMTDFALIGGNASTQSIASPISGSIDFHDKNMNSLTMNHSTANNTSWWVNGESFDYDIYTTNLNQVVITLPTDTLAFSFNVGADLGSTGNNAWLTAVETDGSGIDTKHWFNVNRTNTPGFGIYSSTDNCSYIQSVTIDPLLWGFGNFSISQGDCSTTVPEPNVLVLFGLGFLGLGLLRRREVI